MQHQRLGRHLVALALWTLAWGVFFGAFLLGREQLSAGDLTGQFHAYALFQARELEAGRVPLWSPGSYGGLPFAADPQAAVFYPPRWLTILVAPAEGLPFALVQFEALAHVWLAGALSYGLLYALTRRRAAGLFAAVSFALGGYLTGYPLLQLAILETVAWLPGVLLAIHLAFAARRPAPWLVTAGLGLALAGLAGHPQTWMQVAYLSAAWFLACSLAARWPWRRVVVAGALVVVVALGVSAVGWLPALRYALHTVRSEVDYAFVSSGIPLADWVQALAPTTMSLWAPQYAGIATVALALVGWRLRGWAASGRWRLTFWAGVALVSAWLALGDAGALYRVAHRLLPGLALFRQQERWLGLWAQSASILGGLGLAAWLDAPDREGRRALGWAARALAAGFVAALLLLALWRGWGAGWEMAWLRHVVMALLALGVLLLGRRRSLACVALILLLAVDLYLVGQSTIMRRPPDDELWAKPAWLAELQADELERWDLTYLVYANWGEIYGLETISGISPMKPKVLEELQRLPRERYWQLLNVRYVVSTQYLAEGPGLTQLHHVPHGSISNQEAEGWVYRVEQTLPRAYLVHAAELVADEGQAWARLADPAWDPASSVVLLAAEEPPALPADVSENSARVAARRTSPRSLAISVESTHPGYLVLSEWRLPGWRATVDGEPARLYSANYAFQAVYLPAGVHAVTLTYTGADVLWSGIVSLVALLGALAVARFWRPQLAPAPPRAWRWPSALSLPELRLSARAERLVVGALTLAALGLRLYALGRPELAPDEAWAYLAAVAPGQAGDLFVRSWYPLLLRGWAALFGVGELALRLPAALAGAAVVPALWRLVRRWASPGGGVLVAALAAISPALLGVSQSADGRISLALLLVTLAAAWLWDAASRGGWRALVPYLAAMALALGLWPPAGWLVLAHGAYLLAQASGRRSRRLLLLAWAPFGAAGLAWAILAPGIAWATVRQSLDASSATAWLRYLVESLSLWVGGAGWGAWASAMMGVGGLLLVGWLMRRAARPSEPVALLLAAWLAAALGGAFLSSLGSATDRTLAALLAAPAWWGAVALWARHLWRRGQATRWAALLALVGLVAVSLVGVQRYDAGRTAQDGPGYAALAQALQAEAQLQEGALPHTPLVLGDADPRWTYYLRETGFRPATLAPAILADPEALARAWEAHSTGDGLLWAATPVGEATEGEALLADWLARHALPVREIRGARHTVAAYSPPERAPELLRLEGVAFGEDGPALIGAHLLVNGRAVSLSEGTISLAAGDRLDLTLLWEAAGPTARPLTVFVHLVDGEGRLVAQHDGPPFGGQRPTTGWGPGERILDRHALQVPAQGAEGEGGALLVGLYDSESIERVRARDGQDAIRLCRVILGR